MPLPKDTILEARYKIEKMLAHGGMGAIYQGFDTNLNIPVAIKENFFQTPQSVRQFQQEAQILARLHHPNLPRVIHHFSHHNHQYLVMDFIEGQDLWEMVETQGQPLDEKRALLYILQVCNAVDYLHRQTPPIIHRDIKPQNIKITPDGQAMLVDFGIAKIADDSSQTSTGARGVTPGFSPPEQYSGAGTTPVSDVFSLGATLYAVLTGKKPPNSVSLLVKRSTFQPPDQLNTKLTRQVSQAVVHAMEPVVQNRPQSVAEWQKELKAILDTPTEPKPPVVATAVPTTHMGGGWLIGPTGESHRLKQGTITLGRGTSCDIPLQDPKASRLHARLHFDGQYHTLFDEGSANGTFVNGHPVGRSGYPVNFGNRIRIGDTVFTLRPTASGEISAPLLGPAVDELAGTAYVPPVGSVGQRPPSTPIPVVPQPMAAAPVRQSGGGKVLWLGFGLVLVIILVLVAGVALFFMMQRGSSPPTQTNVDQIIAAAIAATDQAKSAATSNVDARATLAVLAQTATAAAQLQVQVGETPAVDTEATIAAAVAAAVAATEQAKATDTPAPTQVSSDRLQLATKTPLPTATSLPAATPTVLPTATPTLKPTATPVSAASLGIFQDFESDNSWKRGDEANGELNQTSSQVYQGSFAAQLSYNFATSGNDYVVFLQNRQLAGEPKAISAQVYGDGAGHFLNLWLKDAQGQSWQMNFGRVTHTGWQPMTALLSPGQPWPSGPISGADNGVIDFPISFQGIVLDDSPDSFNGRGTIFIDNLTSQAGESQPVASATPRPTSLPGATATPANAGRYILAVAGQHKYETWGAPNNADLCESYRNNDFNDKIHMKGFNLELSLKNNSTVAVADNWTPTFTTAKGKSVQVCYYSYAGSGPLPGATTYVTFFTVVDGDDYVRTVRLEINSDALQICLDANGAQLAC